MITVRSVKKANLKKGQKVLLRTDFDIPLKGNEEIIDDFRLQASLPTIKFLLQKEAKVILLSHLGRPEGKIVEELRLTPVAKWLRNRVGKVEYFAKLKDFGQIKRKITQSRALIFLLENLRFYPGEEENDPQFTRKLASLAEIFVNDAFAVSHRQHASVVGLPRFLPSYAGLRIVSELQALKKALSFKKDLVVVLGGFKTKSKIPAIKGLIKLGAVVLLGGVLANTFLAAALGIEKVDGALVDRDSLPTAQNFLKRLDKKIAFSRIPGQTTKIWLPQDVIVAQENKNGYSGIEEVYFWSPLEDQVREGKNILDIGPKTIKEYIGLLQFAKGIIFNGPLGKFEEPRFEKGTQAVFRAIAQSQAFSMAGGGETIAALEKFKLFNKIDYVSSGGGAMLEYIAKGSLPGIEAGENYD